MSLTKRNSPPSLRMRAIAVDRCVLHEAPLPVPPLRPGIGMDQVDPRQRLRRGPGQQFRGVAGIEADIADIVRLDLRQDLRHAVDIGLAADEPDVRKGLRLRDQMLAAAESDFEPDILDVAIEQLGKPRRRGRSRYRAPDAAADCRSGRPGGCGACGPCGGRRTSRAHVPTRRHPAARRGRRYRAVQIIIAASGTAGTTAAPSARSRRCTSARNGYARPGRRRRARPASRYAAR